jgi:integrase
MGAYTTVSIENEDQYRLFIEAICNGFVGQDGVSHRGNNAIATIIMLEANLGIRLSDIVKLHLCDIIKDGNRYRLDITEQKTGAKRTFTVPDVIYEFINSYCIENHIQSERRIFQMTERNVQKYLKATREYLGVTNISSHSFRKYAAHEIFELTGHNIEAVREFLQHSSITVSQRYLKTASNVLEDAIQKNIKII